MSIVIQLLCFFASFLYGIFVKFILFVNSKAVSKNKIFLYLIINIISIYLLVLGYIIVIYRINHGIFHIYFLMSILIGYLSVSNIVKFLKNKSNTFSK